MGEGEVRWGHVTYGMGDYRDQFYIKSMYRILQPVTKFIQTFLNEVNRVSF